jgi:NTP pyrophosphatase (non-canonical NTP hydrolase)
MADLQELQTLVHEVRQKRGFTMEPLKIFAMLNEEVGEVATELKRTWSPNYDDFTQEALADELADVLVCVLALANQFDIDLEQALVSKLVKKDSQREWKSAGAAKP